MEIKKRILICNDGCDDTTDTVMKVTKKELEFLIKFAKENNKNSHCQCQPTIRIYDKMTKKKSIINEGSYYYTPEDYEKDLVEEGVE